MGVARVATGPVTDAKKESIGLMKRISRMSSASSERGKKGGVSGHGKSKSSDVQFYLIEEIVSKNNLINQDMAWYAETFRNILAWLCSEDVSLATSSAILGVTP